MDVVKIRDPLKALWASGKVPGTSLKKQTRHNSKKVWNGSGSVEEFSTTIFNDYGK